MNFMNGILSNTKFQYSQSFKMQRQGSRSVPIRISDDIQFASSEMSGQDHHTSIHMVKKNFDIMENSMNNKNIELASLSEDLN